MKAGFVMDTDYLARRPDDSARAAQWAMRSSPHHVLYVVDPTGYLVGMVPHAPQTPNAAGTVADMMVPVDRVFTVQIDDDVEPVLQEFRRHPEWFSVPVVEKGRMRGVIPRTLSTRPVPADDRYWQAIAADHLAEKILGALYAGLIVIDAQGITRYLNKFGADLLGTEPDAVVDRPYEELAQTFFPHITDYLADSAIPLALTTAVSQGEREFTTKHGRRLLFKFGTIREQHHVVAIVVTFVDVTVLRHAEIQAKARAREAEMAFGLSLPNSKIEMKLQTSPEYQDIYDPATGRATVTRVIPDGTYYHVVNGLRLLAELKAIGVFQLVGFDKDTMVQAFIFHDIGKEQPHLHVGQEFVPQDTFEPSERHAHRSADWAAKDYHVSQDVQWLIRYHHTPESALPTDFPASLKPMWRLFKVVDGLSAAITRRNAHVAPLELHGTRLRICEDNDDKRYHRHYELALYGGESTDLPESPCPG